MALREFAGAAPATKLSGTLSAAATSFTVVAGGGTGYPTGATAPFEVTLDRGTASEERILCSARAGDTFTVAASGRGYDGTAAVQHGVGAAVEHTLSAVFASEVNAHVNNAGRDDHSQYLNKSLVDAKGDLLVGANPDVVARLGVGGNGTVLRADSANTTGVKWADQTCSLIAETVLSAAAASIDFQNIPQTYRHLMVEWECRSADAVTARFVVVRYNNDAGTDRYLWQRMRAAGTTVSAGEANGATFIEVGAVPGTTTPARPGSGVIHIPNYRSTAWHRSLHAQAFWSESDVAGGHNIGMWAGVWRANDAINRVQLLPASGSFVAGSVASLYGIGA